MSHRGPILTVANWSGQWPGLVGMLNLNGSLTKAGIKYSTLWSDNFDDDYFLTGLARWLKTGATTHRTSHVRAFGQARMPIKAKAAVAPVDLPLRSHCHKKSFRPNLFIVSRSRPRLPRGHRTCSAWKQCEDYV